MASWPARTIFTSPGGISSTRPTVSSATSLLDLEFLGEARPFFGQGSPLTAVQSDLEDAEAEQRALESDRRQRDANLFVQLLAGHLRDLGCRSALDHLRQHRRRRLADRAAAALEPDVVDPIAVEGERDGDLVAAERVHALG